MTTWGRSGATRLRISDTTIAEEGYGHLQRDLDTTVYPPIQGLLNLQRFMRAYNPRLAEVKAAELVDTSILDQLAQTGFLDSVFRRYGVKGLMIRARVALFSIVLCALHLSVSSAATKVAVGYSTINPRIAPLWIAQDRGLFQKYGLDTTLVFVRNTPLLIASMK